MNRAVRTNHDATTMESELDPEKIVMPTTPLCCPLSRIQYIQDSRLVERSHEKCSPAMRDMKVASTDEPVAQTSSDITGQ